MKVVLHICCAVCAAGAAERLLKEGHSVRGFFFNPNVHPLDEYGRRLAGAQKVAAEFGFPLTVPAYDPGEWHNAIKGLEAEPEGGARCPVCFRLRLTETHKYMLDTGGEAFTTTLTMGSNKSAASIGSLGESIAGGRFLKNDFKKKEGFKRAGELARQFGIYRQHYCGCIYSLQEAENRRPKLDTTGSP